MVCKIFIRPLSINNNDELSLVFRALVTGAATVLQNAQNILSYSVAIRK